MTHFYKTFRNNQNLLCKKIFFEKLFFSFCVRKMRIAVVYFLFLLIPVVVSWGLTTSDFLKCSDCLKLSGGEFDRFVNEYYTDSLGLMVVKHSKFTFLMNVFRFL